MISSSKYFVLLISIFHNPTAFTFKISESEKTLNINNPLRRNFEVFSAFKDFQTDESHLSINSQELTTAEFLLNSVVPWYINNFIKNDTAKENFISNVRLRQQDDSICLNHLELFINKLGELLSNSTGILDPNNSWALQMIDSWGKIPEGILSGHVNPYGDYDECIDVKMNQEIRNELEGQYCWIYLVPASIISGSGDDNNLLLSENKGGVKKAGTVPELLYQMFNPIIAMILPSMSACVPSTCSLEEIQIVSEELFRVYLPNVSIFPGVSYCRVKESPKLDGGQKAMIGVLSVFAFLILLGSILDWVSNSQEKFEYLKTKLHIQVLVAFSLPNNIRKWQNTSSGEGGFSCIHGIRFLSTCWVILCHTIFLILSQGPTWNAIDVNNIYKRPWHFYVILNGYFSVDTFFTMSGLLACFSILKALDKTKGKLNIIQLYVHRYLRLTPTYALIIGLLATLFPLLGSGPNFSMNAEGIAKNCRKFWWHNLLYINNIWRYDPLKEQGMCEGESWYIANDMQFFILSPVFVFLLWKWKLIGMAFLGAASLASILTAGIVVGTEKLPPTQIFWKMGSSLQPRSLQVYMEPWYRIGPYLVGIWMGYFLYKNDKKPVKLPKLAVIGGWLLSTAVALALIFGVMSYYDPENEDNHVVAGIYGGISRFLWGVVICWIIFACVKGHGGWVNDILSCKAFVPLGRLTFCVYLSSLSVQTLIQLTLRQPMVFNMYHVVNMFFSHLIMCFLVGLGLTLMFESPFISLEKILLGKRIKDHSNNIENGKIAESRP